MVCSRGEMGGGGVVCAGVGGLWVMEVKALWQSLDVL